MSTSSSTPEWIVGLRSVIKDNCGSAWRIMEHRGKCKLDVRLSDGSRKYKQLGIPWDRYHARRIQETVEQISANVDSGMDINEAIAAVPLNTNQRVINVADPQILLDAWVKFETYKTNTDVIQSTWNKEWGGEKNLDISPARVKQTGKTYKILLKVADSLNADQLFTKVAKMYAPGTRSRQMYIRNLSAFLRWATGSLSGYLLNDKWKPFAKGDSGEFVGRLSSEDRAKKRPTIPIELDDVYKLLESLPYKSKHKRDARAANGWGLIIKLCCAFGLRPEEVRHLKIIDGELWSMWIKKSGGGTGKERWLQSFPPELAEDWDLINEFKKVQFPEISDKRGVGESFGTYLKRNNTWKEIRTRYKAVTKSFRHAYSKRCHINYRMTTEEVAGLMGHTPEVHLAAYSEWITTKDIKAAAKRAIENKKNEIN